MIILGKKPRRCYSFSHMVAPYDLVIQFGSANPPTKMDISTSAFHLKKGSKFDFNNRGFEFQFGEDSVFLSLDDVREVQIWKPNPEKKNYSDGKPNSVYLTIHQMPHEMKGYKGDIYFRFFDVEWR